MLPLSRTRLPDRSIVLAAVLALLGAACAPPAPQPWQKAGASDAAVAADIAQCRAVAQQQATRLYPYGSNTPSLGGAGMVAAQQQANIDRDSTQLQLFHECMEGKGYSRTDAPAR